MHIEMEYKMNWDAATTVSWNKSGQKAVYCVVFGVRGLFHLRAPVPFLI